MKKHDNYLYQGNDLGVTYQKKYTEFKVWAPTAKKAEVLIYNHMRDKEPDLKKIMTKENHGIRSARVTGDLEGKYFIYKIYFFNQVNETIDPYVRGVGTNGEKGLIVNLNSTNPLGWENDKRVELDSPLDAIIYEIHVKDFSMSENSGMKNKGKFLAFTETKTNNNRGYQTGLSHLKELGITHLHLLPVFDFASVDESNTDQYNWGYDPLFYNVPEGSYATDPSDVSRIIELKKLIKTMHDNNIGVILDVVYNHTYSTENSPFNLVFPDFYYRKNQQGEYSNGSGVGNELATEKPMVRKFIIDSVKYWAEEYHVDGFRFDLMALIDKTTMGKVENALHKIDDSIIIYGEPWMGGESPLPIKEQIIKGNQKGMDIAVFNDNFRNALKGGNDDRTQGFISGDKDQELLVKKGIVGEISYDEQIKGFALEPSESINYVSSHDNLTLWDKLALSNKYDSQEDREKMDRLAQAIIFTSQGIPFIQGGEEILRTKYGNKNSYNAGDKINSIKWERKTYNHRTFKYYQGLIKLRKRHPAFHIRKTKEIRQNLTFLSSPPNTICYSLGENANRDSWKNIVVIFNPAHHSNLFSLPFLTEWKVVVEDDQSGINILRTFKDNKINVSPISACILYDKKKTKMKS